MSLSVGPSDAAKFSPECRRCLSAPGLRTFLALAAEWDLTEEQQLRILGMPLVSTYRRWAKQARGERDLTLSVNVLMRISAVLGIYQALRVLCEGTDDVRDWLTGSYNGSIFQGRAPLAVITSGSLDDLLNVRRFLEAGMQGLYLEPDENDTGLAPIHDEDIVWV